MLDIHNNDANSLLMRDILKDRRAERRWKNIRFICWFALFAYIFITIMSSIGSSKMSKMGGIDGKHKYAALIRLDGMIAPGRNFSAEEIIPTLKEAFADRHAEGLVIDINSPGGTPVQAAIIHDAIISLKNKYHKKVIIVGEDLLTSGAYYVAVAADKIYVNPNTLTGSIGVIMKGFGFVDTLKKIGAERRVYLSGNAKDRLDPFLPQTPEDTKKIQQVMSEVHQNFAQAVLDGRKGRLHAEPSALFNGDFWAGSAALKLGLVDGLGNLMDVMEKEFHTTNYKEFGSSSSFLKLLGGELGSAFDAMFYVSPV